MSERFQIYKCEVCGNIVEVLHSGMGELVCCNQPMKLLKEKTQEAQGKEKHIPVIEENNKKVKIKVGSILHPMQENHYIEWIEIKTDEKVFKKFLKPKDEPIAEFEIKGNTFWVRAYCNIHGLWKIAK